MILELDVLKIKKGVLIVFSGLDNTGKSSQIQLIRDSISTDLSCQVIWGRLGYTPGFNMLKRILRRQNNFKVNIPNQGDIAERSKLFAKKNIRKAWLFIALLDFFLYYGVYLRILVWKNDFIVCDRYVLDSMVDLIVNFPEEKVFFLRFLQFIEVFLPKPNVSFLLLVDNETALMRSKEKNEPFPESREVYDLRRSLYQKYLPSQCNVVDTSSSINDVNNEIIEKMRIFEVAL